MKTDERWRQLQVAALFVTPLFITKASYLLENKPDAEHHPVSHALANAALNRIMRHLVAIGNGVEAIKADLGDRPGAIVREMLEIESWFIEKRKPEITNEVKDAMGDILVSRGFSYSQARNAIEEIPNLFFPKGAPNKRPRTLQMMDARIKNHWSYQTLARKMCDCGETKHNELCSERIRKRLKELKAFLKRYDITYPEKSRD
ncbi:MAG TPA: hypothetical protein VNY51_14630 [Candidatus Dormibacteraeota bacterium]|jgi:hypothetical protein|nr:hypothetical protein [Candidatus Dormibacteraeota bacterium]